jgi:CheY-like chemotaxis protein
MTITSVCGKGVQLMTGAVFVEKALAGKTILVVDDDPTSLHFNRIHLSLHGAEVVTASSVAEALGQFWIHCPAVLVSDICMPQEDGLSMMRKIRSSALDGGADIPAIAISGLVSVADHLRSLDAGFDYHLTKPYMPEELVTIIQRIVRYRQEGLALSVSQDRARASGIAG